MAVRLNVTAAKQVVVPIRFTRAANFTPNGNERAYAEYDSPELDDRGYFMGTRPTGWSETDARGPMLGLTAGAAAVRVKVVRERIDAGAPLFVTSTNPAIVEVTAPAGGGPLAADGVFSCRGLDGEGDPPKLQVRLGSAEGPVLGELEPHVFSRITLPITPHLVRIDTTAATGTRPTLPIATILQRVRKIWHPCGIDFTIQATQNDNIRLPSNRLDTFDFDNYNNDMPALMGIERARLGLAAGTKLSTINCYVVEFLGETDSGVYVRNQTLGYGQDSASAASEGTDPGIIVISNGVAGNAAEEERTARTIAHEIGHFLRLEHTERRNSDNPADYTYSRRQLMFPLSIASRGRVNNFGNGKDTGGDPYRGHLITLKDHAFHVTDGECGIARRIARGDTWK